MVFGSGTEVSLTNITAQLLIDVKSSGDQSPFILFDGDNDGKVDKRGSSSAKTDVVKSAGAGFVQFPDQLTLKLKGNGILVQAKAHSALLPDKVIGEGQAPAQNGQQTVRLVDPKTGQPAGEVSFFLQTTGNTGLASGTGLGGHHGTHTGAGVGGVGGAGNQGYSGQPGATGYNSGVGQPGQTGYNSGAGQPGYNTGAGQPTGAGYNTGSGAGYGQQQPGGGALTTTGGASLQTAQQPGQYGQQQQGGIGGGQFGGQGQSGQGGEFHEKRTHNVSDHNESETFETSTRRL